MRERRYAMTIALVVGLLFIGSLLLNVTYTRHVQQQADRRQAEQKASEERARHAAQQQTLRIVCGWLEPQVDPNPPPTTPRGRKQLAANQEFYEFLHCEGVK